MTQPSLTTFSAGDKPTAAQLNDNELFSHMIARNRNVIINGEMILAQRGTSFSAIANGTYSLDRWKYVKAGAAVHTITQDALVPSQASADDTLAFSLKLDVTTADASIAAGDFSMVFQIVEGYRIAGLLNRECTFSFWVRANRTGTYCVAFVNAGNDRSYVVEYTIDDADTLEKKSFQFTMHDGASGTWDFTNGQGLKVYFTQAAGSTFQTTPDAWQTGQFFATANQVNNTASAANDDFYVTGVQLEPGNVATPFEHVLPPELVEQGERYYQKSYDLTDDPGSTNSNGASRARATNTGTAFIEMLTKLSTRMRAIPTVTWYSTDTGTANEIFKSGTGDVTVTSTTSEGQSSAGHPVVDTAIVVGGIYIAHFTSDAEL